MREKQDDDTAAFESATCLSDIDPTAAKNIQSTMAAHKPYWKFMQPTADE
jgi:hypothetical protein